MARVKAPKDPSINARGIQRQRWPAPRTPQGGRREGKVAFRLSAELREQVDRLSDADRIPVSSWLERAVRKEVEHRLSWAETVNIRTLSELKRSTHADHADHEQDTD